MQELIWNSKYRKRQSIA